MPASASVLAGSACAGSAGFPGIQLGDGSQPWLGDPVRIDLSRLPWFRSALVMLGASNQMFGTLPLPLDLHPVGMPNCKLAIAPLLFVPVSSLTGSARLDLVVPNDAGLSARTCMCRDWSRTRPSTPPERPRRTS